MLTEILEMQLFVSMRTSFQRLSSYLFIAKKPSDGGGNPTNTANGDHFNSFGAFPRMCLPSLLKAPRKRGKLFGSANEWNNI